MTTITGEVVCVRRTPDLDALRKELQVRRRSLMVSLLQRKEQSSSAI